jgi:primosomal protein N' (replication factor Y) (superfamily II helicase)
MFSGVKDGWIKRELMNVEKKWFVNVILPLPLPELFTYEVPEEMRAGITPGVRVVVQFGKQKVYSSLVYECHHQAPHNYTVKEVLSVLDELPVVTHQQFKLWKWMSEYYQCAMGEVMLAALPSALRLESESKITRNPAFSGDASTLTDHEYLVYEALEFKEELTLKEVSKILSLKYVLPVVRSLVNKNVLLVHEEVAEKVKPRFVDVISLNATAYSEAELGELMNTLEKKAPKQLDIILTFLHLSKELNEDSISKSLLIKKSGSNSTALNALIKKNVFLSDKRQEDRIGVYSGELILPLKLNPHQEKSLLETEFAFENGKVALLHGVTSSGKTELYIHLIRKKLDAGKQVLYLLPEIALTAQLIARLQKHFGDRLLVYHSRFNEQERVEVWNKLLADNLSTDSKSYLFFYPCKSWD